MSFYVVECEYDLDNAVKECTKLMSLRRSSVKIAFNNMAMVKIFMNNLAFSCENLGLDPEAKDFHMDVLVDLEGENNEEGVL